MDLSIKVIDQVLGIVSFSCRSRAKMYDKKNLNHCKWSLNTCLLHHDSTQWTEASSSSPHQWENWKQEPDYRCSVTLKRIKSQNKVSDFILQEKRLLEKWTPAIRDRLGLSTSSSIAVWCETHLRKISRWNTIYSISMVKLFIVIIIRIVLYLIKYLIRRFNKI